MKTWCPFKESFIITLTPSLLSQPPFHPCSRAFTSICFLNPPRRAVCPCSLLRQHFDGKHRCTPAKDRRRPCLFSGCTWTATLSLLRPQFVVKPLSAPPQVRRLQSDRRAPTITCKWATLQLLCFNLVVVVFDLLHFPLFPS